MISTLNARRVYFFGGFCLISIWVDALSQKMKRPKIHLRSTKWLKILEWLSILFVFFSFLLIFIFFSRLPESIPIYFNWPSKDSNGMGNKELLWAVPLITGVLVGLLLFLSRFPWLMNYPVRITEENAERNYQVSAALLRTIAVAIAVMGLLIILASVIAGMGSNDLFGNYLMRTTSILLLSITAFYFIKLNRLN